MGKHHLVHWFIHSVYERNPPKPKYDRLWDFSLVFNLFKAWPDNRHLSLDTGHKGQTIVALSLDGLEIDRAEAIFNFKPLLKYNRTGDYTLMLFGKSENCV